MTMAEDYVDNPSWDDEDEGPVLPRRRLRETVDMDITPMIDITFLLLVFFLVCSTMDQQAAVKLPGARHGTAVNERSAVIITVANGESGGAVRVYLGDGKVGTPLSDDTATQAAEIHQAVADGFSDGKTAVLIKAEKDVKHGDVSRVAGAAAQVEGVQHHWAVLEIQ